MAEAKKMRLNKVLREFNISLDRAVEFLSSKGFEIEARPTTKISNEEYQVLFDEFQTDKSKKIESKEVGEEKRKEKEELRLERERELEEKQQREASKVVKAEAKLDGPKQVGKIDLDAKKPSKETKQEKPKEEKVVKKEELVAKKETPKEEVKKEAKKEVKAEPKKKPEEAKKEKKPEDPKTSSKEAKEETKEDAKPGSDVVETNYKKLDGPNFTGKKIDLAQFKKPEKKKTEKKENANKPERKSRRRRISKGPVKGNG